MSNEIPIAIIGGGVIGCAVAWELSKKHQGIFLFENEQQEMCHLKNCFNYGG